MPCLRAGRSFENVHDQDVLMEFESSASYRLA